MAPGARDPGDGGAGPSVEAQSAGRPNRAAARVGPARRWSELEAQVYQASPWAREGPWARAPRGGLYHPPRDVQWQDVALRGRSGSVVDLQVGAAYSGVLRIVDASRSSQRAPLRILLAEGAEHDPQTISAVLWEPLASSLGDPAPGRWIRLHAMEAVRATRFTTILGPPTVAHVELRATARGAALAQVVEWCEVAMPGGPQVAFVVPMRSPGPPALLELCCGAFGPFSAAANALGMHAKMEVDKDPDRMTLLRTTRRIIPGADEAAVVDLTDQAQWYRLQGADVWTIGAPCQSTSSAGAQRGANDPRDLFATMWALVSRLRPPVVVIEVVPGFWADGAHAGRLAGLAGHPYVAYASELELSTYVPQNRRRGCVILVRLDIDGPGAEALVRAAWPLQEGGPPTVGLWQVTRRENPNADREAEVLRVDDDLLVALGPRERTPSWPGGRTFSRVLGDVSGTVMAAYGPPAGLPHPWYAQIAYDVTLAPPGYRWLRPRELARLQGLPEQVALEGVARRDWRAIGDALPPVMAGLFLCKAWAVLGQWDEPTLAWEMARWAGMARDSMVANPRIPPQVAVTPQPGQGGGGDQATTDSEEEYTLMAAAQVPRARGAADPDVAPAGSPGGAPGTSWALVQAGEPGPPLPRRRPRRNAGRGWITQLGWVGAGVALLAAPLWVLGHRAPSAVLAASLLGFAFLPPPGPRDARAPHRPPDGPMGGRSDRPTVDLRSGGPLSDPR